MTAINKTKTKAAIVAIMQDTRMMRGTRILFAYHVIMKYRDWVIDEMIKEITTPQKDMAALKQFLGSHRDFLDWGKMSEERLVIKVCARLGVVIPDDPVDEEVLPV